MQSYQLNTTTIRREVDDHSVVNPYTRGSLDNILAGFLYPPRESLTDQSNTRTTSTSGQKRHHDHATPNCSKKFKGDGCSISGEEVVTPLALQSGNMLSSPTGAVSGPNYGKVWINILEEPEEYYRARYASEGSRGPIKGQSSNSYPKVKLMVDGQLDYVGAVMSVSLVHSDGTPHNVCSLTTAPDEDLSCETHNISSTVNSIDLTEEFDQLRIKREKYPGKQSTKSLKYDESVGFLLFQAEVFTTVGKITCYKMSSAIKLTSKPESAEIYAIKNEYASVEGGDEVWIRGSKMIGNPTVLFEIRDQSTNSVKSYRGTLKREECHQNLLVVKTPSVPFTERVMSQVVVMTSKKKMRSNSLPFMFVPTKDQTPACLSKQISSSSTSSSTPPYSPQLSSNCSSCSGDLTDFITLFSSSSAIDDDLNSTLDICVLSLDKEAEEKILPTAMLPINSLSMQGSSAALF